MIVHDQTYYIYISIYLHATRISAIVFTTFSFVFLLPVISIIVGNTFLQYIYIYSLYINNIIVIITIMHVLARYLSRLQAQCNTLLQNLCHT